MSHLICLYLHIFRRWSDEICGKRLKWAWSTVMMYDCKDVWESKWIGWHKSSEMVLRETKYIILVKHFFISIISRNYFKYEMFRSIIQNAKCWKLAFFENIKPSGHAWRISRAIWRVEFCSLSLLMLTSCLLAFLRKDRQFHHLNENVVFVRQHSRFSLNDSFLCFSSPLLPIFYSRYVLNLLARVYCEFKTRSLSASSSVL